MKKKIIIAVVILVVIIIVISLYNRNKRKKELALANSQFQVENTNGAGLIGYLTGIFNGNSSGSGMSEEQALEVSKEISNLYDQESESGDSQAVSLTQQLFTNGWTYVGYNQVTPINAEA